MKRLQASYPAHGQPYLRIGTHTVAGLAFMVVPNVTVFHPIAFFATNLVAPCADEISKASPQVVSKDALSTRIMPNLIDYSTIDGGNVPGKWQKWAL
jgi:hypothetical protein